MRCDGWNSCTGPDVCVFPRTAEAVCPTLASRGSGSGVSGEEREKKNQKRRQCGGLEVMAHPLGFYKKGTAAQRGRVLPWPKWGP